MEDARPTDDRVDHYRSLDPFQFSHLRRLELRQFEGNQVLTLELGHDAEVRQLTLTFEGVTGEITFLSGGFQPVPVYLEVICIRDYQWEGQNYQVYNLETDVGLSFYCREFRAEVQDCDRPA